MYPVDDLVTHLRDHVLRDTPQPWLFDDELLLRLINEAYKVFARRTHYFVRDSELYTIAGVKSYNLPKDCIYLRSVEIDNRYLDSFTRRAKPRAWEGRPAAYSTDTAHDKVRFWPVPDEQYVATIVFAHTPKSVAAGDNLLLPDEWALALADYVAFRALRNNDPDGSATIPANDFFETWNMSVSSAKAQVIRQSTGENPSAQPRKWA